MTKLGFRLLCHWKFRAVVQHVLFPRLLPSACSEGTYVQDFHVTYYVVSLLVWLLLLWGRFVQKFFRHSKLCELCICSRQCLGVAAKGLVLQSCGIKYRAAVGASIL